MSSNAPTYIDPEFPTQDIGDIQFLSTAPKLSHVLASLRRAALSPRNRLLSIRDDARFVSRVQAAYSYFSPPLDGKGGGVRKQRPLVANERCGSWYVAPGDKAAGAYFKSTDGHTGVWKFSTRRLNLHLLDLIEANDGCIIADSTRRGKRMPDALSKTVPLWCAVINLALFGGAPTLHTPPNVVSLSEHAAMLALVPGFCAAFGALGIDFAELKTRLTKPLRPVWVTPETVFLGDEGGEVFADWRPVICCTASRRIDDGQEYTYVQGAGDDTENWALGLTAPLFWANCEELLACAQTQTDEELAALITKVVESGGSSAGEYCRIAPGVYVAPLSALPAEIPWGEGHVVLTNEPAPTNRELSESASWVKFSPDQNQAQGQDPTPHSDHNHNSDQNKGKAPPSRIQVALGKHKTASRNLRLALPEITEFLISFLTHHSTNSPTIVFACPSATDLSVGAALAALCWLDCTELGPRTPPHDSGPARMSKEIINAKRAALMMALPDANPSRATLQSVNSFLMDWRQP